MTGFPNKLTVWDKKRKESSQDNRGNEWVTWLLSVLADTDRHLLAILKKPLDIQPESRQGVTAKNSVTFQPAGVGSVDAEPQFDRLERVDNTHQA